MALEEGRTAWLRNASGEDITEFDPENTDTPNESHQGNGRPTVQKTEKMQTSKANM